MDQISDHWISVGPENLAKPKAGAMKQQSGLASHTRSVRNGALLLLVLLAGAASVVIAFLGLQACSTSTRSAAAHLENETPRLAMRPENDATLRLAMRGEDDDAHRCRKASSLNAGEAYDEGDDHDGEGDKHGYDHQKPRFHFCVDDTLVAQERPLRGIDHGLPRHGTVVVDPQGGQLQFVSDEIIFQPASVTDLQQFLARYNGTVLRDGTPMIIPNNPRGTTSATSSGIYLIRVDLARSSLGDLEKHMDTRGLTRNFRFSSLDAAHLLAIVGREPNVGPNFIGHSDAPKIPEHPDGMGGNLDAATFPWLNDSTPLQTNVIRAWGYLRYEGFPPDNGPERPSFIAIADDGFALDPHDPTTSAPLNGNLDYGFFLQADTLNRSLTAGGAQDPCSCGDPNCKEGSRTEVEQSDPDGTCRYHGQAVFSTAAAIPGNSFGIAGTGSEFVHAMLIRTGGDVYAWADAIRSAGVNGADVVNLSSSEDCSPGGSFGGTLCRVFDEWATLIQSDINFVTNLGTVVVIAAGNSSATADTAIPCSLDNVICVAAVDRRARAETYSNFGGLGRAGNVTIWAPDYNISTPNPITANSSLGQAQLPLFSGTSAAAPFVSGVVALIKRVNHGFLTSDIKGFLQTTANPSPDPKVSQGIVNALGAVMAASPSKLTIQITSPADGSQVVPNALLQFIASVGDPAPRSFLFDTVQWTSNRDGVLCTGTALCAPAQLSLGQHVITATATNTFGTSASASITITVIRHAPTVTITYPPANATFHTSQQIEFRGYAYDDVDGTRPPSALAWSSNIDGKLLCGTTCADIFSKLSPGTQVITLSATNSAGLTGSASVTVQVVSGADFPSVTILSPTDNASFAPGNVETLIGQASDPVDPTLPFVWTDSVDGALGTTNPLSVKLSGTPGVFVFHTITLSVTNMAGHTSTSQRTVNVGTIL